MQIINVKSTLFPILEILGHSFKFKIKSNTSAALIMKVILHVCESSRDVVLKWTAHKDLNDKK